ncbi:proteasome subunit beta type-2-like [Vanessa atalanta]|uniref:proteasome subunit beta type-2-like n=1 Tax=Vanessa atalanta TaxID=42275 RepID=UPI001FCDF05B|nr:proteasome subunit beta type-2-like [Vanessa atalanta]
MANTNLLIQCQLGIQCKEFTIIAADQMNIQSFIIMKDDADKLIEISERLLVGVNGDAADTTQFTQFVEKNLQLYLMKNKYQLDTPAIVHFTRKSMADALRDGNPRILNMLIAGYDEDNGCQLYTMDFLASCMKVPYAAHGLGGLFSIPILNHYYKPSLSEVEAYEVIKLCVRAIQKRLFITLPNFLVKTLSKDGVKVLPVINPATFMKS